MALKIDILGAGVAGRLCALYLTDPTRRWPRPLQLTLYDKAQQAGGFTRAAARVAAAMLCPQAESALLPAELVPLAQHSLSLWQDLAQQLPGLWLQQQGCILLSHPQQQPQLQQQVRQLKLAAQPLDATQLSSLEPALSGRFNHGWFCPQDAQTDSDSFLQHSQAGLQQRGVRFLDLTETDCDANQLSRAKANCDLLLDCRGLGAKTDWPKLRPVRGEILRLRCSEISLKRPVRYYHPRYSLYVAPKAEQQFVVGATEIESASEQGCTVRSALELLSALYALHPGFAEAEILTLSASARPTLPSPVPQIQQQDGVIALNGLSRHGYLLGPVFARQTADLAQQLLCH